MIMTPRQEKLNHLFEAFWDAPLDSVEEKVYLEEMRVLMAQTDEEFEATQEKAN